MSFKVCIDYCLSKEICEPLGSTSGRSFGLMSNAAFSLEAQCGSLEVRTLM